MSEDTWSTEYKAALLEELREVEFFLDYYKEKYLEMLGKYEQCKEELELKK